MGLFDSWKARAESRRDEHVHEAAVTAYGTDLAAWAYEDQLLAYLAGVARALAAGQDAASVAFLTKKDEHLVWTGTAALHEVRSTPGQYAGGSHGVSIPIGLGIRYRVGAMRGTYTPGPQVDMQVDAGEVFLTTQRIAFTGARSTREWAFVKWISAECDPSEHTYVFHVSNRQKPSGLVLGSDGPQFNRVLGLALALQKESPSDVVGECESDLAAHQSSKPTAPAEPPASGDVPTLPS